MKKRIEKKNFIRFRENRLGEFIQVHFSLANNVIDRRIIDTRIFAYVKRSEKHKVETFSFVHF